MYEKLDKIKNKTNGLTYLLSTDCNILERALLTSFINAWFFSKTEILASKLGLIKWAKANLPVLTISKKSKEKIRKVRWKHMRLGLNREPLYKLISVWTKL